MDKRSSLFCRSVSDEEKKFYKIVNRRKILNVNVVAASLCAQGRIFIKLIEDVIDYYTQ